MNLALWFVIGLLAAVLLVSRSKMFVPREKVASVGAAAEWVLDFSPGALRAWPGAASAPGPSPA
jgi:hypothetical protein